MHKNNFSKKNKKLGFTLIESLIAISILMLTITAPLYIVALSIKSSLDSRDTLTAFYLASEAVEVIRNNRDKLSLTNTTNWLDRITVDQNDVEINCLDNDCVMYRGINNKYYFNECNGATCPYMTFASTTSSGIIYSGPDLDSQTSKFKRRMRFEKSNTDSLACPIDELCREFNLIVEMTWNDRGQNRNYTIVESLHNLSYKDYAK